MEKIYIRADANSEIGTGHVMRCLSIANKIRELQSEVTFIVADKITEELITDKGYGSICLDTTWNDLESEVAILKEVILENHIERILIDHYFVTEYYLREISKVTDVFYMDDLNSFLYPVQKVINYNIYAEDMMYEKRYLDKGMKTEFMLGTRYVPLREEFEHIGPRKFSGIKNILIATGGTDNYNLIGNTLDYFMEKKVFDCYDVYCVVGYFNVNKSTLIKKYGRYDNVHLLCNIANISEYMKQCDFCISAGGSTVYELCACGTPSVLVTIADNQLDCARKVSEIQLISWIGDAREDMRKCLENVLTELDKFKISDYWENTSRRMQELVDGKGASRIAAIIVK